MTNVNPKLPESLQKSLDATKVEYVRLGNSGLRVSLPILGALSMGSSPYASWLLNKEEALKVLKVAYDNGINTWDTAPVYSNGQSEEILGAALRELKIPRQKVIIMTKCGFAVGEDAHTLGHVFLDPVNKSKDYVNQGGKTVIVLSRPVGTLIPFV